MSELLRYDEEQGLTNARTFSGWLDINASAFSKHDGKPTNRDALRKYGKELTSSNLTINKYMDQNRNGVSQVELGLTPLTHPSPSTYPRSTLTPPP